MKTVALSLALILLGTSTPSFAQDGPKLPSQKKLLCGFIFRNLLEDVARVVNPFSKERQIARAIKKDPSILKALQINVGNRFASPDNQLAFRNTARSMDTVCENTKGFCRGYSSMSQAVGLLAFYDPQMKFSAGPTAAEGSPEWVQFYVAILKDMMAQKPRFIPGFANLHEFSGHPALTEYFKVEVALAWARQNAHLSSLKPYLSQKSYTPEDSRQFVRDLNERLALGYNVKIIFDENANELVEGVQNTIHVPLALATYPLEDNKTAILLWDDKHAFPNQYEYLVLNHDSGKAFFWPWKWLKHADGSIEAFDMGGGYVNQYRVAYENDREVNEMAYNLDRFCRENPQGCAELAHSTPRKTPKPALKDPGLPLKPFKFLKADQ